MRPRKPLRAALALVALTWAPVARAADFSSPRSPVELEQVRALIKAKDYPAALRTLRALEPANQIADVFSLIGFTLRKTGDRTQSMTYYRKALALDPDHRGALEYQGELFVELGQLDNAKQNLAKLSALCLLGCEERSDLQEAIEHAEHR